MKIRAKFNGGHAGHNGLRSIDAHIDKEYWRIRLGIGHPGVKAAVHSHVLSDFSKNELEDVARLLDATAEAAPLIGAKDFNGFMSKVSLIMSDSKHSDDEDTSTMP